eukprot:9874719-Alexandrium_andersonii.AAC.1
MGRAGATRGHASSSRRRRSTRTRRTSSSRLRVTSCGSGAARSRSLAGNRYLSCLQTSTSSTRPTCTGRATSSWSTSWSRRSRSP